MNENMIMAISWIATIIVTVLVLNVLKKRRERQEAERLAAQRRQNNNRRRTANTASRTPARTPAPATSEETGDLIYFATDRCGLPSNEYRFNYKKVGSNWRAYITKMPAYGVRDTALGITHRYRDTSNNMHYICWDTALTRLADIQSVSRMWADLTQVYIATGKTIDAQVRERR